MITITFDTHQFVRKLRDAGISEAQAEVITEVMRDAVASADVATKSDVESIRKDMEILRAELKKDIAETKSELVRWVVGAGFLQTALIAGLLIKLIK